MTALENDFSDTLGDAARWVTDLLRSVLLGTAIVLVLGVGWIMWRLFENLRRTEDAVRQSEAIDRSLVMDAPVGIGSSRRDGRVRTVNPALVAMLGYANAAELLTKDAVDVYEAPEERVALLARLASGEPVTTETRWRRKDGGVITVRLSGHEVRDAGAADEHISFIVEDVTQTRLLQEQVRQAQKMDAVGLLAGGVAHDFNNMLTVILGAASLLLDELPDGNPAREEAEMIRDVGLRASELTGQLLAFGRKQALAPRVLDLNAVVRETGKLVRPMLGEGISLELELAPDLPAIHADRGQLEQVVVSLAVNARDAMAEGGTLRIETSTVSRRDVPEDAALPAAAVDHARLRMSDTGAGMDAATLGRVFEPFFTTKPRGKGTGLGLATVHGIVHQSGGRICVRSEPGRGATFDVYLPSTTGVAVPRSPQAAPAAASTGDETVLVVDDQDEVMRLTSRVLRTQGYSVLEARSGADALRVAAAHAGTVHLLVTDVMMPGLNGRELAAELLRERPGLRVLYLSGYSGGALVNQGVIEPGIAVLSKPFTTEGLARRVRDVLLAAPARAEGTAGVCSRPMTSLDRSLALFPLLALAVACGSSTTSSTSPSDSGTTRHDAGSTHHDAGSVHKDSGLSKGDAGADVGTGLTAVYTTACTPPFDAGAMKSLTETVATVPLMCLVSPLTSGVTVVDSASAVAALFAEDASAECALPSIVSGVDFTTDSIAVFPGRRLARAGSGSTRRGRRLSS